MTIQSTMHAMGYRLVPPVGCVNTCCSCASVQETQRPHGVRPGKSVATFKCTDGGFFVKPGATCDSFKAPAKKTQIGPTDI